MRKLQGTQPARRPCYLGTSQSQALEKTSRRIAPGRTSTAAKFITEALALRTKSNRIRHMSSGGQRLYQHRSHRQERSVRSRTTSGAAG
ncbi:hypothetical protein C0Q70_01629 [Pomacea canaliculata]|uniref:Uncharacterized protein n=1 Tax=Pomacea canaliculata TaxID=400727 RepID=A0A2T7Q009_POMCA|nr:hypothetical protein C0Q70_01629 [Pomacea canaliculata]